MDSEAGLREEIVDALRQAGTSRALPTLRNIDWRTGSSINELQACGFPGPADSPRLSDDQDPFFDQLMRNARVPERKAFLVEVRAAIHAVESRSGSEPLVDPASAA